MIMFFLAVVSIIISLNLKNGKHEDFGPRNLFRILTLCFTIVGIVVTMVSSVTTISPGSVGVPVLFGSTQTYTLSEGLHFVNPFISIYSMSTRTQTYDMGGAQSSGTPGEAAPGNRTDDAVNVLTRDQLAVIMEVSIQFHLNSHDAPLVFRAFGENYSGAIVHPIVRAAVRDAASEFTAVALVDTRTDLQNRMEALVRQRLEEILTGRQIDSSAIIIDNILLRNMDLPESLDEAIANVQRQTQATAASRQALETARADADTAVMRAEGAARALATSSQAQAEANRILSQSITPELLQLRAIEATRDITTNPSTRTVILGGGNGPTPLILNMANPN